MKRLAAYRLESARFDDPLQKKQLAATVREHVDQWLHAKGAQDDGTYLAMDKS